LLDRRSWATRRELASVTFKWIEACYTPVRRHTSVAGQCPDTFEGFTPLPTHGISARHECPEDRVRHPTRSPRSKDVVMGAVVSVPDR
jgi:hypothetical protein